MTLEIKDYGNVHDVTREELENRVGQVWDTAELQEDFCVIGFQAPFVVVVRKHDDVKGTLEFQHLPRFYFDFTEDR